MIRAIAAVAEDGSIGIDGHLPWRCKEDLALFRSKTLGGHVVAGRKTAQSIPIALDRRLCTVISRDPHLRLDGWTRNHLYDMLTGRNLWVAGGAGIYTAFLPFAEELHITHIPGVWWGDTFFPEVDWAEWGIVEEETIARRVQRLDGSWVDGDVVHRVYRRKA